MNTPLRSLLAVAAFLVTGAALSPAHAGALDDLQGQWSVLKTNSEGRAYAYLLEFKDARLLFQRQDGDGQVDFVARGQAHVEKQGPFQVLRLTQIEAGRSADDLQAVDEERASVFSLREDVLYIASNFDRERDNQRPTVDGYRRGKVSVAPVAAGLQAKLAGEWKMVLTMGENEFDYQLRFAKATDATGWQATLVSPRTGEYPFKSVRVQEDQLTMEITRKFEGNDVPFLYKGKLKGEALEGTVVVPGAENQFSGTWKARK